MVIIMHLASEVLEYLMTATKQPRVTKLVTKLVVKVYGKLNN